MIVTIFKGWHMLPNSVEQGYLDECEGPDVYYNV